MKILVLNCGSSSVKYKLIDTATDNVMAEGGVEKIGLPDGFLKYKLADGSKAIKELGLVDHKGAVKAVLDILTDPELGCISSYDEIDAVGHRVVHGAEKFSKSVLITDEVLQQVKECYDLAPLHNPANVTGIEAVEEILPGIPQVGVFDTAFHQTMPAKSYMYALPYRFYKEDGVRRYGFHGTSHRYVSARVCEILGVDIEKQRIITCHIGNGGSITAVFHGKSIDTSMGLTPTEGLMMGTRVGDVDPGALTFLMKKHNLSTSCRPSSTRRAVCSVYLKYRATCAKSKQLSTPATNVPNSPSTCTSSASSNISVPTLPKWAVSTSSCSQAAWAKTRPVCVPMYALLSASWV